MVICGKADFSSFVMDEAHLIASIRYIERNPVRAIDFHINNFTALSVGDILPVLSPPSGLVKLII